MHDLSNLITYLFLSKVCTLITGIIRVGQIGMNDPTGSCGVSEHSHKNLSKRRHPNILIGGPGPVSPGFPLEACGNDGLLFGSVCTASCAEPDPAELIKLFIDFSDRYPSDASVMRLERRTVYRHAGARFIAPEFFISDDLYESDGHNSLRPQDCGTRKGSFLFCDLC